MGRPIPALRRECVGRPFPLRRRPRLRRLLPRRHRRDGRSRPGADHGRRRTPDASRHHPHAPDRGRGLGRRRADPTVRCRRRGNSPCRRATRTAGSSASPARSPAAPRWPSTTTAITARWTRPSPCSALTGRSCPVRGSVGPQVDVAETTRVVEFNDIRRPRGRPGRRRRRGRPVRARADERRHRAAGARLSRGRPRDHPPDRHAPRHRRDPHDLRRTRRSDRVCGVSIRTSSSSARPSAAASHRPRTASVRRSPRASQRRSRSRIRTSAASAARWRVTRCRSRPPGRRSARSSPPTPSSG